MCVGNSNTNTILGKPLFHQRGPAFWRVCHGERSKKRSRLVGPGHALCWFRRGALELDQREFGMNYAVNVQEMGRNVS